MSVNSARYCVAKGVKLIDLLPIGVVQVDGQVCGDSGQGKEAEDLHRHQDAEYGNLEIADEARPVRGSFRILLPPHLDLLSRRLGAITFAPSLLAQEKHKRRRQESWDRGDEERGTPCV